MQPGTPIEKQTGRDRVVVVDGLPAHEQVNEQELAATALK
jgi:hypothetical protein